MPRFAANVSMMFGEHAFLDRFAAASAAGFKAVEFLFPYDLTPQEIADRIAAAGLAVALFNMPPGDWQKGERGLAAIAGRQADFRQSVRMAIEYGQIIGAARLHMMAGKAPSNDVAASKTYRDSLAFAADATARAGIGLLIEPLNGRDMPGYFLNDFNMAADIINELGHPNLKLQFDIYHRQILHGDVLEALRAMMPIIGHVQVAAVPLRHEPGSGELNDFRIFKALDDLGYKGYVGCEYRPANGTIAGLGWMESASATLE